jgi:hypothetical protein
MISQSQAIKYHLKNGLNWFTKYILRHINKYTIGTIPENMLRNPLFYKKNLCILNTLLLKDRMSDTTVGIGLRFRRCSYYLIKAGQC